MHTHTRTHTHTHTHTHSHTHTPDAEDPDLDLLLADLCKLEEDTKAQLASSSMLITPGTDPEDPGPPLRYTV